MTTEEFERAREEFGKLSYWKQALNEIGEIRKCPDYWSVRFYSTCSDADIALPCAMISDMLEWLENTIIEEYEKQKEICDSIESHYEQENP